MNIDIRYEKNRMLSVVTLFAKNLGSSSDQPFSQLNPKLKKFVEQFLDENEWELLRGKTQNGLFTIENANRLSEKEIKDFWEAGDKLRPLHEVRNDLYKHVHAMFDHAISEATLVPNVYENIVASSPIVMLIPILFFMLGIFSGVYASNQNGNGWWLITCYCLFLGLANLDSAIRTKQITAALRGKWQYIPMLYLINPIVGILLIIHLIL